MRYDNEHSYDQIIYDPQIILDHLPNEYKFKEFVQTIINKYGDITRVYWIIDLVCTLESKEFPENRIIALKHLVQKLYMSSDTLTSNKHLVHIFTKLGYKIAHISKLLHISRNSVYYFLNRAQELPPACILTYGEYNLMLDFIDAWQRFKGDDPFDIQPKQLDTS
jgi:hypothetical protein